MVPCVPFSGSSIIGSVVKIAVTIEAQLLERIESLWFVVQVSYSTIVDNR